MHTAKNKTTASLYIHTRTDTLI